MCVCVCVWRCVYMCVCIKITILFTIATVHRVQIIGIYTLNNIIPLK